MTLQRGWLDRKEYTDGNGTDYTYTAGGRLATRTWARDADGDNTNGHQDLVTNYAYTTGGDLLAVDYDDAGVTPDVHYTYTRTGQQDVVSEGQFAAAAFTAGQRFIPSLAPALVTTDRSTDYGYNSRFQIETETISGLLASDSVLTRTYEDGSEPNGLIGRNSGYSLSASSAISAANYTYDPAGRLGTVSDGTDTFIYGYTPQTRNLLASVEGPVHTAIYTYEPGRNAMTGIENKETIGTASVVSNYAYSYNALGQRAGREQSGTAFSSTNKDTFAYDYLGQVTASTNDTQTGDTYNPSYAYDEIGNRTGATVDLNGSTSYTQDLLNQYTAVGSNTPGYDADGNLTSNGTWTYTWNGESRLVNASSGATSIDFIYDSQGRLVKKDDGTNVEVYLYDGWNRIAKYVDGSHSETYLYGLDLSGSFQGAGGVGGLLKEGSLHPTYDANGNIVQKLNASGVASMSVEYDPFGNIINGTLVGEYGFSTKPLINGLQWYYYGFRCYDPATGRWPSRDPIEERGGLNLYAMVGNDTVNLLDYLGNSAKIIVVDPPGGDDGAGELQQAYDTAHLMATEMQNLLQSPFQPNSFHLNVDLHHNLIGWNNDADFMSMYGGWHSSFLDGISDTVNKFDDEVTLTNCNPIGFASCLGVDAYVTFQDNVVTFCPSFFNLPPESQAATLLHEFTHLAFDSFDDYDSVGRYRNVSKTTWPLYAQYYEDMARGQIRPNIWQAPMAIRDELNSSRLNSN